MTKKNSHSTDIMAKTNMPHPQGGWRSTLAQAILVWFICVFALLLVVGAAVSVWLARQKVITEVNTALRVAQASVTRSLDSFAKDPPSREALLGIVRTFDGDRHVSVALLGSDGEVISRSASAASLSSVPAWFAHLVHYHVMPIEHALPGARPDQGRIVLMPEPASEITEAWEDALARVGSVGTLFVVLSILVWVVMRRVLRPLDSLKSGLIRIGQGDLGVRIPVSGPADIASLVTNFNALARRLETLEGDRRRLNAQIERMQDEERAELARDLHDDVSPFLFAVEVDASRIRQAVPAEDGALADVGARAAAIGDAVRHIQRNIRAILGRLRAQRPEDLGLAGALSHLAEETRRRHPDVFFECRVGPGDASPEVANVIYPVLREAVANALRHAGARRVAAVVSIPDATDADEAIRFCVEDDGEGLSPDDPVSGFGLIGMRERMAAAGGTIALETAAGGRGVRVAGRLPLGGMDQAEDMP